MGKLLRDITAFDKSAAALALQNGIDGPENGVSIRLTRPTRRLPTFHIPGRIITTGWMCLWRSGGTVQHIVGARISGPLAVREAPWLRLSAYLKGSTTADRRRKEGMGNFKLSAAGLKRIDAVTPSWNGYGFFTPIIQNVGHQ